MKASELRKCAKCALCNQPILSSGLPLFWRVTIERFGVDIRAVQRADAFATVVGSSALAEVMGTDDDLAHQIGESVRMPVCERCGTSRDLPVAALAERGDS